MALQRATEIQTPLIGHICLKVRMYLDIYKQNYVAHLNAYTKQRTTHVATGSWLLNFRATQPERAAITTSTLQH